MIMGAMQLQVEPDHKRAGIRSSPSAARLRTEPCAFRLSISVLVQLRTSRGPPFFRCMSDHCMAWANSRIPTYHFEGAARPLDFARSRPIGAEFRTASPFAEAPIALNGLNGGYRESHPMAAGVQVSAAVKGHFK